MKRIRLFLLIMLFVLCIKNFFLPTHTVAETQVWDYSNDATAYRREVAKLTGTTVSEGRHRRIARAAYTLILIQTDGRLPKVPGITPDNLLRGSRNRFTAAFTDSVKAEEYVFKLAGQPGILYAELDGSACVSSLQPSTIEYHSWGAEDMGFPMLAAFAAEVAEGRVVVAVIDSGVCPHRLISDRIASMGYDYVDGDSDPSNDTLGHGTAVAGIICDCSSTLPVYIMPIRVLNGSGSGRIVNIVNAIEEAVDNNVDVINLSLTADTCQQALHESIRYAIDCGITVVSAAGNDGRDVVDICPSHMPDEGLIVVGAAEQDGSLSSYSNYGETVDIYACGTDIECCSISGAYKTATGTSMATPHVSAACGMLRLIPSTHSMGKAELLQRVVPQGIYGPPIIGNLAPQHIQSTASAITLPVQTRLCLSERVCPETCVGKLVWSLSDDVCARIEGDVLICHSTGTTRLCAQVEGVELAALTLSISKAAWVVPPGALQEIGDSAFEGMTSIQNLLLPDTLHTIDSSAFADCTALQVVVMPMGLTDIAVDAFSGTDAVLICARDSEASRFAGTYSLPYIVGVLQYP